MSTSPGERPTEAGSNDPAADPGRRQDRFPDTEAEDTARPQATSEGSHPRRIGPYRILDVLGEGGMGMVFLAEQKEPVRRRVALKVIKLGMDTRQVLNRFEAERQALAMMDHACIARVLDAGATDQGNPYFAMEYVKGVPITDYCDEHKLSIPDRLALFQQVCAGVQHAHQKGVIHRDLKPSNVLVTVQDGDPRAKIIDFGLARATDHRLVEATLYTELGQIVGTPEYMSPEQAEAGGLDIDTTTDVYSLGVLLYELLSGTLPLASSELRQAGLHEIQRQIKEVEPLRPSTQLTTQSVDAEAAASRRRLSLTALCKELRGELDWIVMKAIEKDRTRRYASPAQLAEDLQRHIDHEPVLAGPPSAAYRLKKLARRYRAQITAAAAVLVALIAGLVTSLALWAEAAEAREQESHARRAAEASAVEAKRQEGIATVNAERAEQEAERAKQANAEATARAAELEVVVEFQASQLEEIDAAKMGLGLREGVLRETRVAMERSGAGSEEIDARTTELDRMLRDANFTNLALDTLKENVFERALTTIVSQFGDQPLVQAQLLHSVAGTLRELGLQEMAEAPHRRALAIRREQLGDEHPDTLNSINDLGVLLEDRGKLSEAEMLHREALGIRREKLGDDHPDTLNSMNSLGVLLQVQGNLPEAETLLREALAIGREKLGDDHPDTLNSINNLGVLSQARGMLSEAETLFREALAGSRKALGDDHPSTLSSIDNLGVLLQIRGKLSEAEPLYREALAGSRKTLGDGHPSTLNAINNLGALLQALGKLTEAEPLYREALAGSRKTLGDGHPDTLTSISNLGTLLQAQGKLSEAEPLFREALEGSRRTFGDDHRDTLSSMNILAILLQTQGRLSEAEPLCRESLEGMRKKLGDDHPDTLISINTLGHLLYVQGKASEAEPFCREALEGLRKKLGDDHPNTLALINNLGAVLKAQGKLSEAEPLYREALEGMRKKLGNDHPSTLSAINNLAKLLRAQGKLSEAEPLFRGALAGSRKTLGDDHSDTRASRRALAKLLATQSEVALRSNQYPVAEKALLEAHRLRAGADGEEHAETLAIVERLVALYDTWHVSAPDSGHDSRAAMWRAKLPNDR